MRSMGPTGNHWRNVVRCAATKALKEERNMSPPLKNFTVFQAEFGYSCAKLRGIETILPRIWSLTKKTIFAIR